MRLGIVSDIHSNNIALKEALDIFNGSIDRILFIGDAVGYGPQPREVLQSLQDLDVPLTGVLGNHDLGVRDAYGRRIGESKKSDEKILSKFIFREVAEQMIELNSREITREDFTFLSGLPPKTTIKVDSTNIYITHGSPSKKIEENVCKYVKSPPLNSLDTILDNTIRADREAEKADIIITGHTHQRLLIKREERSFWSLLGDKIIGKQVKFPCKFRYHEEEGYFINPGSVGQPRDGTGNSSFVIIDLDELYFEYHDINYPREEYYSLVRKKCVEKIHGKDFWERHF
ncbi:MAG: metallophosphoesterase family protein [Candidatus Hodarchaeales archaeon]